MPIYVYGCENCGQAFERRQPMSAPPLVHCPECGGHVHRVIQPVGVLFRGSGFYATDNRTPSPSTPQGEQIRDTEKAAPLQLAQQLQLAPRSAV
jgi:putative FmdB family regulatory protein